MARIDPGVSGDTGVAGNGEMGGCEWTVGALIRFLPESLHAGYRDRRF